MISLKKLFIFFIVTTLIFSAIWYCRLPDINTCTKDDLVEIYMIGNKKADVIIDNRPYADFNELDKLPLIGEKTIKRLKWNTKIIPVEKNKYLTKSKNHSIFDYRKFENSL